MEQQISITEFEKDILQGLSSSPKHLYSKYFYDDEGSRIFQDIMGMPEYYLTNCELEIFNTHKGGILSHLPKSHFELIELGAGDGLKTKILLSYFLKQQVDFKYIPIDISKDAVKKLLITLKKELPMLNVDGQIGDYFKLIGDLNTNDKSPKIILFLGSNIGNFNQNKALAFLHELKAVMHSKDLLLIGFDLKKDKDLILKAYNDPHGHTAAFNLNLLRRINRELNADFTLNDFQHIETYDSESGTAKSYLLSLKKQEVFIRKLMKNISFNKGESIYMEMSQKYDHEMIDNLAKSSGFEVIKNYHDSQNYYSNSLWRVLPSSE